MWWWIWIALIVAALVGAFFVLRVLWRKVRAVFSAAADSAELAGDILASSSERTELRLAEQPSTAPTVGTDPLELLERVELLRDERLVRKAVRRLPCPVVYRRWLSIYR